jgi:hypothetical protein
MYEKHNEPLISTRKFIYRLLKNVVIGCIAIGFALMIGMVGYHYTENMSWVDAFLNASMILSGMGPVEMLKTTGGKIFAGSYALFSGLAFILIMGMILAPVIHRFFHYYHVNTEK